MSLLKCLIYGLVIAILIIIIINLFSSLKENFDDIINNNNLEKDKMPSPSDVILDEKKEDEKKENDKSLIDVVKNTVNNTVDNVKEIVKDNLSNTQTDDKQEDINILPKYIDEETKSIMDAPKLIPESVYSPWANVYMNDDGDTSYMIDLGDGKDNKDGGSGRFSERSPACCSAQYPIPFKINVNDKILKNKDEYVPNPYMGNNNWENAGCTCMTKENAIKLATRGYNA